MKKKSWTGLVLLSVFVTHMIIFQDASCLAQPTPPRPPLRPPFDWDFDYDQMERLRALLPFYFTVKTIIVTMNSVLISFLVLIHLGIYRKTGTKFSLGLMLFSIALLMYTIAANPLFHRLLGFRRIGLGPILMIPDLFTCLASAILLYLSRQ